MTLEKEKRIGIATSLIVVGVEAFAVSIAIAFAAEDTDIADQETIETKERLDKEGLAAAQIASAMNAPKAQAEERERALKEEALVKIPQ